MTNFKPSELPADTVVSDEVEGVWMKEEGGVWGEITAHCPDCARSILDAGRDESNFEQLSDKADDFFLDFKVISWPADVVNQLLEDIAVYDERDWRVVADREEILRSAIEAVQQKEEAPKPELEWRHLDSFQRWYAEINEDGQVRTDWDGKIYSPVFDCGDDLWVVKFTDPNNGEEVVLDVRIWVKQQFNKDYI